MKKILTVTEIETLKWMAILAELKIKELQKENNPEKQILSDFYKRNIMSILNKLL
jgi:hypothetical protein